MGRYKKITLIFCFLCLLFSGALKTNLAQAHSNELEKLPKLIHVLKDQGAKVKTWSLYTREQGSANSIEEVKKQAQQLKKAFPDDQWTYKNEKMDSRYVGKRIDPKTNTTETLTLLVYPRQNAYQTYLIYVVSGSKWEDQMWKETLDKTVSKNLQSIFKDQQRQIFACTTGVFGDKMNVGLSQKSNSILRELHAHPVEADQEQTFTSVSAYTELWDDSIISQGKAINVQIGIRKDQKTTVTLGTPIITTEY